MKRNEMRSETKQKETNYEKQKTENGKRNETQKAKNDKR